MGISGNGGRLAALAGLSTALILTAAAQQSTRSYGRSADATFADETLGFKMRFPKSWKVTAGPAGRRRGLPETLADTVAVTGVPPLDANAYVVSVKVQVIDLKLLASANGHSTGTPSGPAQLGAVAQAYMSSVRDEETVESREVKLNNVSAFRVDSIRTTRIARSVRYFLLSDDGQFHYIITESADIFDYGEYAKEFERIAVSFTLAPVRAEPLRATSNDAEVHNPPSKTTPQDSSGAEAARHLARAHQLYEQTQFNDALDECDAVLRVQPQNSDALQLRGLISNTLKIIEGRK